MQEIDYKVLYQLIAFEEWRTCDDQGKKKNEIILVKPALGFLCKDYLFIDFKRGVYTFVATGFQNNERNLDKYSLEILTECNFKLKY